MGAAGGTATGPVTQADWPEFFEQENPWGIIWSSLVPTWLRTRVAGWGWGGVNTDSQTPL